MTEERNFPRGHIQTEDILLKEIKILNYIRTWYLFMKYKKSLLQESRDNYTSIYIKKRQDKQY
jgi:hypothetical protein